MHTIYTPLIITTTISAITITMTTSYGHVCILPNTRIHFGSRYNIGLLFSLQEAMRLEERREKMSAEIYGNISFAPRIDALSKVLGKATGT